MSRGGSRRNLAKVKKKQKNQEYIFYIVNSRSFGCCPSRNGKAKRVALWPIALTLCGLTHIVFVPGGAPLWLLWLTVPISAGLIAVAAYRDNIKKTVVLFYSMEPHLEEAYQALHNAFDTAQRCGASWQIPSERQTVGLYDWKTNSGVDAVVTRRTIRFGKGRPSYFKTNIVVPFIPARWRKILKAKFPGAGRRVKVEPREARTTMARRPATYTQASDSRARLFSAVQTDCLDNPTTHPGCRIDGRTRQHQSGGDGSRTCPTTTSGRIGSSETGQHWMCEHHGTINMPQPRIRTHSTPAASSCSSLWRAAAPAMALDDTCLVLFIRTRLKRRSLYLQCFFL